ncbi:MAG: hypothetical protein AB4040_02570 [Synechococcus sp.]
MKTSIVNPYLSIGLISGLVAGWLTILFGGESNIPSLSKNIGFAFQSMSVIIPIVSIGFQVFISLRMPIEEPSEPVSQVITPFVRGCISYVGALALFLVATLIISMVIAKADGGELRDAIYQTINWNICLIGLAVTVVSFYIPKMRKWTHKPQ